MTETAYERIRDALTQHGSQIKESDRDLMAQCPAHDDRNPSLHVWSAPSGDRARVYCHAGCDDVEVLAALGLAVRDLFDEPRRKYTFPDQTYENHVRGLDGKKNVKQSPGRLSDTALYRVDLPGDEVWVVEGPGNVEAAEKAGLVATCNRGGSGAVDKANWSPVYGKNVVLVRDKDDAGRKFVDKVTTALAAQCPTIRVVESATGDPHSGHDLVDHLNAGHSLDELVPVNVAPEHLSDLAGATVLDETEAFMGQYLHLPSPHALTVLTLWAAHTWASKAFYVTPRIVLDSPEPGSGKTRVLELLALLCQGGKLTLSTTTAALYRRIAAAEGDPPTILQDEADAIWGRNTTPQAEDLRALYNAGYKAGATVDRCEGDAKNMKVVEFPVFAPVALAGLAGKMPATITTRSITIHMRRRAPGEHVAEFRERDANAIASPIREMLAAWMTEHRNDLGSARPTMPKGVRDRPAEVWEALVAVADQAGGEWPDRARAACRHYVLDSDPDELSLGARLLRDVREVLGSNESIWSADLISDLTAGDESEWADLYGKPLDQRRLAREMKRYGVKSDSVRIGGTTKKGYRVDGPDGLAQAWERYLPVENPSGSGTSGTDGTSQVRSVPDENAERNKRNTLPDERNKRNTNGTPKTPPDQAQREHVPSVPDVPHIDGSPTHRSVFPPEQRAALGRCGHCEWHPATQGHAPDCKRNAS